MTPGQDASAYHAGARAVPVVDGPAQDGHAVAECPTMTGGELRALRKAAGWSQTKLAALCEVSLRGLQRWERPARRKAKIPLHSAVVAIVKNMLEAEAARRNSAIRISLEPYARKTAHRARRK